MRFAKYVAVNGGTLLANLLILFLLVQYGGINYLIASGAAFVAAESGNFLLNRKWTFKESREASRASYAKTFTVATATLGGVLALMAILVQYLGVYYLLARVIVACLAVMWSYLLDKSWSFRM